MKHRLVIPSQSVLALALLAGCSWLGDVSSNMRVDTGLEPQNIDSNVRFRTTYYFRVLTGCSIDTMDIKKDGAGDGSPFVKRVRGEFVPLHDSLYRFRMTGQAAALFNRVHFESGVLRKEQIDPFGSSVRYNEQTHAFAPISADDVRVDNARHAAMQEVEQFRKLYRDLDTDEKLDTNHKTQLLAKLVTMIEDRLDQIKASRPLSTISPAPNPGASATNSTKTALTTLEEKLGEIEEELGKAQTQLGHTQGTLDEAKKKVADIRANLLSAKTALTSSASSTKTTQAEIDALSAELTAAEQALNAAEINRNAALKLVTGLTGESTKIKADIEAAHKTLTTAKQDTTRSLNVLKTKVEDLLRELGTVTTTPPAKQGAAACGGKPSENRYYLLGPEGAKELDPNDRLLLALSVDSKPLISALQQLSDRRFQSTGTTYQIMETLLHERGQILDAQTTLRKAEKEIGQDVGSGDQSKLKILLEELRKPYASTIVNIPAK
ncbi:MAG: hypothetical protein AB7P24_03190 [Nitrospira sp.]